MALAEFFFTPGLDSKLLKILERALKSGGVLQLTQLKTHWLLPYQTLLKGTLHKYTSTLKQYTFSQTKLNLANHGPRQHS